MKLLKTIDQHNSRKQYSIRKINIIRLTENRLRYINWFHYLFVSTQKHNFIFPRRKCALKRLDFPTIYIFSKDYYGINNKKERRRKKSKIMHIFLWVFYIKCAFLSIFIFSFPSVYRCFRILIFFPSKIAKDTMNFLLRLHHRSFFFSLCFISLLVSAYRYTLYLKIFH